MESSHRASRRKASVHYYRDDEDTQPAASRRKKKITRREEEEEEEEGRGMQRPRSHGRPLVLVCGNNSLHVMRGSKSINWSKLVSWCARLFLVTSN